MSIAMALSKLNVTGDTRRLEVSGMFLVQKQPSAEPLIWATAIRWDQHHAPGQKVCLGKSIANSHLSKEMVWASASEHLSQPPQPPARSEKWKLAKLQWARNIKGNPVRGQAGYPDEKDWHKGKQKPTSSGAVADSFFARLHQLKMQPDIPSLLNHLPSLGIILFSLLEM